MGAQYSRTMRRLFGMTWEWPASCDICGRWPAAAICPGCADRHGRTRPRCPGCALPLAPGLSRCAACTAQPNTSLSGCVARVAYQYPWSGVVAHFKFHNQPGWAGPMARLMVSDPAVQAVLDGCDLWTPIPLGPSRLRQRGYNQAWELLKALRQARPQPPHTTHSPDLLLHTDHTRLQHTLQRADRLSNAAAAFQINPSSNGVVQNRRVLLIDDVMTTGTTLEAGAQCLLAQGAQSVHGLVFARTPATTGQ